MLHRLPFCVLVLAVTLLAHVSGVGAQTTSAINHLMPWTQTAFRSTAPSQPRHVNRVVVGAYGRVFAAWYSQDFRAYVSYTDDGGTTWRHTALDRMLQIHQMIRLQNGTLVAAGESFGDYPVLWYSQDNGLSWKTGASGLPNAHAAMVWDLAERAGEVIITTSSESNVATQSHPVVYAWSPASGNLRTLASLPGIGALAVAVAGDGTIFVSTQESAEHDDPATAGQGRVYRSSDGGVSWSQTAALESANRIYALTVLSDGSVVAGSGLNGGFYRMTDGMNWSRMATLPAGRKAMGSPPVMTDVAVTRVYKVLELASGALLVGSGNSTGDLLLTCDLGGSWIGTERTGGNNVVWGLAQESDGTVWIGNGSEQGDVWKAKTPQGISAGQHFSCTSVPQCSLSANPVVLNAGDTAVLRASCTPMATSYAWTGGACTGTNTATCTVNPANTTAYTFTGSNVAGSSAAISATLYVCNTPPAEDVAGVALAGTSSNELFHSSIGSDTIDGAGGVNTVAYHCKRANFSITASTTGWVVSSVAEGFDKLSNVQRLQFADKTLALDVSGNAGQAYRIYQAAFDRTPDAGGLKYWIGQMDNGMDLLEVAARFVDSNEFRSLYGTNPTNASFLTKLYNNVLHRQPEQGGYDWWLAELDSGRRSQTKALADFSESDENKAGVLPVIQNGIELPN